MSLQASLSAAQAFTARLGVQADNIANVNTDGFKKGRTLMQEAQPTGVRNAYERVNTPGPQVVTPEGDTVELSNVELAEEMPQTMVSPLGLKANVAAVRAQDEMLGTLLDIKA